MLLKLKIAATKQHAPVNQAWSTIAAFIRASRQRARDRRMLSRMNDHTCATLASLAPDATRLTTRVSAGEKPSITSWQPCCA